MPPVLCDRRRLIKNENGDEAQLEIHMRRQH